MVFFRLRFSILSPNVFHIGVKEKVSITVFDAGPNPVNVKLYLQDYPNRRNTFSQVQGVVRGNDNGNIFNPFKAEQRWESNFSLQYQGFIS